MQGKVLTGDVGGGILFFGDGARCEDECVDWTRITKSDFSRLWHFDGSMRSRSPGSAGDILRLAAEFTDDLKAFAKESGEFSACALARREMMNSVKPWLNADVRARSALDAALRIYSDEGMGAIYRTLNRRLRNATELRYLVPDAAAAQVRKLLGTLQALGMLLLEAILALRPEAETAVPLFRGGRINRSVLQELRAHVGGAMAFTTFTSLSIQRQVAEGFRNAGVPTADEERVIYRLRSSSRGRLGGFSVEAFQGEEEVLIAPFSTMAIEDVRQDGGRWLVDLVDLPLINRGADPPLPGSFSGTAGGGFLWFDSPVTPDFDGVDWTRVSDGDFANVLKFDRAMRLRKPRPPSEVLKLVPLAAAGLRDFGREIGDPNCGSAAAAGLEQAVGGVPSVNRDKQARAALDAALQVYSTSDTRNGETSSSAIYLKVNERLRGCAALPELSPGAVSAVMRERLGSLFAYAELLVEAVHALRPAPDRSLGQSGYYQPLVLWRGGTILEASLDEIRSGFGRVMAFTSFTSFTQTGTVALEFANMAKAKRGHVPVVFLLEASRRGRLGGFTAAQHMREEEVLLPPFSVVAVEAVTRHLGYIQVHLVDLPLIETRMRLFVAAENGDVEVGVSVAADPALLDVRDCEGGNMLLHFAANSNRVDLVRLLLKYGAYPDALDSVGRTPLWWSVLNDSVETAKALLSAGADRSLRGQTGNAGKWTPLQVAVKKHFPRMAAVLAGPGEQAMIDAADTSPGPVDAEFRARWVAKGRPGRPIIDALRPQKRIVAAWAKAGDVTKLMTLTPEMLKWTYPGMDDSLLVSARRRPWRCCSRPSMKRRHTSGDGSGRSGTGAGQQERRFTLLRSGE
jgi:hypothetical protein